MWVMMLVPVNHSVPKQKLEADWRQRVQDAKQRNDEAFARAQAIPPGAPDQARADEEMLAARAEYMDALRIWHEIVDDGTSPPG